MTILTRIICQGSSQNQKNSRQLTLTISSLAGFGSCDTSVFSLNKKTGQLTFSHFYKEVSHSNGILPHVKSGQSVPFSLTTDNHLYPFALSEMLTYAQEHCEHTNDPKDKQKILVFIKDLQRFLPVNKEITR